MVKIKKISILGAGAFGFAIANVVAEKHDDKELFIYDISKEYIDHIHKNRSHPVFHEGTKLPNHITATMDLNLAVKDADLLILAIPSKFVRSALKELKPILSQKTIFVNLAKGLEANSNKRVSQIINEELNDVKHHYDICCLSGGMIAREVTLKNPLAAELACEDIEVANKVADMLKSKYLRIETTSDLVGVELAGAFKNVIAIGAGMFDGMGYSESSKSAFVSAAAKEFQSIAVAMGAQPETFGIGGHAWLGDLMTTCFGASRNRELGELLGKGIPVREAVKIMIDSKKSIEGYITTDVLHNMAKENKVESKLLSNVHKVLYKKETPQFFVNSFVVDN